MTRSDDLTGLLIPPDPTSPFRQGVVVAYNTSNGFNSILIGGNTVADGAVLFDLPILNIGDTVNLLPGDVVVLMKYLDSWAIMGRVITPGGAALNTSSVDFSSFFKENPDFANTAGFTTKLTQTVPVPLWANRAAVVSAANVFVASGTLAAHQMNVRQLIDGVAAPGTVQGSDRATFLNAFHNASRAFTVTPGGTFNVDLQTSGTTIAPFDHVYGNVNILILFRKA